VASAAASAGIAVGTATATAANAPLTNPVNFILKEKIESVFRRSDCGCLFELEEAAALYQHLRQRGSGIEIVWATGVSIFFVRETGLAVYSRSFPSEVPEGMATNSAL